MVAYVRTHTARSERLAHAVPAGAPGPGSGPGRRGVALIELLVALALGLFLVGGIMQILGSNQTSYRLTEVTARSQENGRYALRVLSRQFRQNRSTACRDIALEAAAEGGLGLSRAVKSCALLADPINCTGDPLIGTATPLGYTVSTPAEGSLTDLPGTGACAEVGQAATARCAVGQRWLRGDVLVSWGVSGEGLYIVKPQPADLDTRDITLLDASGSVAIVDADFRGGHLAMISDCGISDIFTISNPAADDPLRVLGHAVERSGVTINTGDSLSALNYNAAGPRPRVFPFDLVVGFICCVDQNTGRVQGGDVGAVANCTNDTARYRPALCVWSASGGSTQALTPDVADLSVRYHVRSDTTGSTAEDVADWSLVTSAQVRLLVTGGDEVKQSQESPQNGDLGVGMPQDRRLYHVFETTVAIRSRDPNQ